MELNDSLGFLLNVSARLLKQKHEEHLKENNITTSQWAVLKLLSEYDELSQAQIAEKLYSDRATTGTVIDKLIQKEMISKKMCMNDRRSFIVNILPETKEKVIHLTEVAEVSNQVAMNEMSPEDMKTLERYLKKIIFNLEEEEIKNGMEK